MRAPRSLFFIASVLFASASACSSSNAGATTPQPDASPSDDAAGDANPSDDAASDANASGDAASDANDGTAPTTHAAPPSAPATNPGDGTGTVTFAVTKLYLGDTLRDGTRSPDAWKSYGYDLDGKISTATSTDLCKPADGAAMKTIYPDGVDGTDNSYGKNVLPILLGLSTDAPQRVNDAIAMGSFTTLIDVAALGAQSSYAPLAARMFDGAPLGAAPKFDGTDAWPVTAESVTGGDISMPIISLPGSCVANGTWVSGPSASITIGLPVIGAPPARLTLRHAFVSMTLDATHTHATGGVIAGVLSTAELVAQMRQYAGALDPSLCSGPTIDSIVAQLTQASDILMDGTQDPSKTCDGISIGLGFDASVVTLGPVAAPVTTSTACQ